MTQAPVRTAREQVVLLDADGTPIGTADKDLVHDADTRLHLAFSCHVRHVDGRMLVTRRALGKRAFPGIWTNAFCGHPAPGEDMAEAVRRRGADELGLEIDPAALELLLPEFRYRAVDAQGVVENEICPVFGAVVDVDPRPNADEVAEWAWVEPDALRTAAAATPFAFSPWLVLQLQQLPR